MNVSIRAKPRLFVAGVFAATLALPGPVLAQLNYSGYTNGCFGAGCTPTNSGGAFDWAELTNTNSVLRFANSTFSGTVANETDPALITAAASGVFQQQLNNLGAFFLTMGGTNADTYSDFFTLAVRFVDPGSGLGFFTAVLTGTIQVGQSAPNRVEIAFDTPGQSINWNNSVTGEVGVIDLSLSEQVIVIAGQLNQTSRARIGGEGLITVAPEPLSMLLVGSGLAGLAGVARRRRRQGVDSAQI